MPVSKGDSPTGLKAIEIIPGQGFGNQKTGEWRTLEADMGSNISEEITQPEVE